LQFFSTTLLSCSLIIGLTLSKGASSCPEEPDYNTEVIFSLELDQFLISDELIGYQISKGKLLYPLADLLSALEIDIHVEKDKTIGHIFSQKNKLFFNTQTKQATYQDQQILGKSYQQLTDDQELACYLDTIYVSESILKVFLPAEFEYKPNNLTATIIPSRLFPVQIEQKKEALQKKQRSIAGYQDKSTVQRYRDTAFSWNIMSLSAQLSDDLLSSNLSIETGGRFLYHDIGLFASTNPNGQDTSLNLVGSRRIVNPNYTPFLSYYEFGDISVSSVKGVSSNHIGTGISLTNQPLNFVSEREIDLTGTIAKNWFVELYLNDILTGFSEPNDNNRFSFERIILFPGRNLVKYVFYGPQGEIESSETEYFLDDLSFNKEKLLYKFNYVQTNLGLEKTLLGKKGKKNGYSLLHSNLSYGATDSITIKFDVWHKLSNKPDDTQPASSTMLRPGIKARYSDWMEFEYYMPFYAKNNQQYANQIKLNLYPVQGLNIWADADFYHDKYTNLDDNDRLSYKYKAGVRYYLSNIRTRIASDIESSRSALTGQRTLNSSLSINNMFKNLSSSLYLERQKSQSEVAYRGSLSLNYAFGDFIQQASISGSIDNDYAGIDTINYSNRTPFLDHWLNLFTMQYSFKTDSYQLSSSVLYTNKYFSLGVEVGYEKDGGVSAGLSFNTSLIRDNHSHELGFSNRAQPSASLASVGVKIIKADGSEDFITNGSIKVDGRTIKLSGSEDSLKNDSGTIISGIDPYEWVTIELDEGTLEDSSWMVKTKPINIMVEPGGMERIIFTVVETGEIDGMVLAGSKQKAQKGVKVLLTTTEGAVVKEAVSAFDGFYLFDRVEPGEYIIKINPDYLARKKLKSEQKSITLNGDNMFVLDNHFVLLPDSEPSLEAKN
jgi:hypothetical protein